MKHIIKLITIGIITAGFGIGGTVNAVTLQMVPSATKIKPGQSITVDIVTDNPAELSGATLTMTYPTDTLFLDPTPVTTDYFPTGSWQANTNSPGLIELAGLAMESGSSNTKLFSVHLIASDNAPTGLYNITLQQTRLCNGPAGWGTDNNNNGVFDAGDEYESAPLLYSVSYQPGTQEIVTSILLDSFASNPQFAFRVQGGKNKTAAATSQANQTSDLIALKQPSENEFGVSVNPLLEVVLSPDFTASGSSQILWQIAKDQNFSELTFQTAGQPNFTDVQIPALVLDPQTTYYWRVNGIGADGQLEILSIPGMFTTGTGDAVDLDGNGIPDSQDVGTYENRIITDFPGINVAGLKVLKNDGGQLQFAIAPGDGVLFIDRARWENPDETIIPDKQSIAYPSGLLAFRLNATQPKATATVTLYYSTPINSGSKWRNYDPRQGWFYASSSNAVISKDRRTVVLKLTDGGDGDADGVANGVIVDLGGPSMNRK